MDTVTQSTVRKVIPFSGGAEATLPSGPHHYSTKTWIGSVAGGVTPERAFESLSRTPLRSKVQPASIAALSTFPVSDRFANMSIQID